MKHLVIGLGEVGKAVQAVLKCEGRDWQKGDLERFTYDMIHICFPHSNDFVKLVDHYKKTLGADGCRVVVHSTVPLGTCDPHGWVHSPIRGVHPNLEEGIRTFVKYFGGVGAAEVAMEFSRLGIQCVITENAANTEALKLWDTTQYGLMIAMQKEIFEYCEHHDLDFDLVYGDANKTYNEGYRRLAKDQVVRPYLTHIPGPIGGHCIMPNAEMLDSPSAQYLVDINPNFD